MTFSMLEVLQEYLGLTIRYRQRCRGCQCLESPQAALHPFDIVLVVVAVLVLLASVALASFAQAHVAMFC